MERFLMEYACEEAFLPIFFTVHYVLKASLQE